MSDLVLVEREEPIAVVLLNRPKQLNALSDELMGALVDALRELDGDEAIRCIVVGGSERAFAAGADIAQLAEVSPIEMYYQRRVDRWDEIRGLWTPLVAAVSGFCLGGGCELAMACDLIVASETARFGQPETGLGLIPGAGGTQRLTRAVGKAVAMDVILSGRFLTASEAVRAGLVARLVAKEAWLDEAKRRRARHRCQGAGCDTPRQGGGRPCVRGTAHARSRVRAAAALRGASLGRRQGGADRVSREAAPGVQREVGMPDIDELLKGARDAITVKRVYADPIESDGVTIVPAAVVRGVGGGGGDDDGNGGGGFGLHARPTGAWVIRGSEAAWKPAVDLNRIALFAFLLGLVFALRRSRD